MKALTKSKRIYLVVLAVVAVAFTVDRAFLGGYGSVQQAGAGGLPGPVAAPVTPGIPDVPRTTAPTLAEALRECDTLAIASVREAFQPSESWQLLLAPPPPPVQPDPAEQLPPPEVKSAALLKAQTFADSHHLVSVIRNSDGGTALVDDRVVQFGQMFDGFKLVRLTDRTAFFEADGMRVELRLPSDGELE